MSESSRQALVVPVQLKPHINSNNLSIVVIDGFQVVVNTEAWLGKTSGCYIQPETILNTNIPEFSFLKKGTKDYEIIRAKRLRGEWSVGFLAPTPEGFNLGDDCWDYYKLQHHEPEPDLDLEGMKSGHCCSAPPYWGSLSKYDVENWRKFKYLFKDDEPVSILEKVNGANMSCVYSDGEYHVKSRNLWKKDDGGSDFWKALHNNEPLKKYLRDNENHLVQGEMTGKVKGYTYGLNGKVEFYAFDIRKPDYKYIDSIDFHKTCLDNEIKTPRVFYHNQPYIQDTVLSFVDGEQWNNPKGIREGVVIKPVMERYEPKLNGRLILKCVSNAYLEKSGK